MPNLVLVTRPEPHVTVLTLNRPDKRNALSIALMRDLHAAVSGVIADRDQRVLIFAGAGPSFCAGLDLKEAHDSPRADESARALADLYKAVVAAPLVTIAAAHGAAMGGGAGLVAACDLAVAGADLRLAYPEVTRGLVAALVTCLLRRQLPDRRIRELILLGQTVSADQAAEMGLVTRAAPAGQHLAVALELAHIAAQGAPGAVARAKRLLDNLPARGVSAELDLALEYHLTARHSAEASEGVAAFLDKRPPRWDPRPEIP